MKNKKYFLSLCLALSSITLKAADTLEVRIKLRSVNDVLTFNQAFVPDNHQEYAWMVLIDTDNNPATGNTVGYGGNTGFDIALTVSNFKLTGSVEQTGSIVSITQKNTIILNGTSGTVAHNISAFLDYADTSLVLRAPKTYTELANVSVGNRYYAITTYYPSTGITVNDVSPVVTISNAITDPANDVSYSFIDIKGVSINLGAVGIAESNANRNIFNIYPNPSSGIFKVETGAVKYGTLKVVNLLGEEVLQQPLNNEIDLSETPKGIYFVTLMAVDGSVINERKIIVQ